MDEDNDAPSRADDAKTVHESDATASACSIAVWELFLLGFFFFLVYELCSMNVPDIAFMYLFHLGTFFLSTCMFFLTRAYVPGFFILVVGAVLTVDALVFGRLLNDVTMTVDPCTVFLAVGGFFFLIIDLWYCASFGRALNYYDIYGYQKETDDDKDDTSAMSKIMNESFAPMRNRQWDHEASVKII